MTVPVIMPKLEMSQETATLIEWLVKEGEKVEKGQPLLEVETDKITLEIEAPASGLLANVSARPGDVVPVTSVIAQILEPGETAAPEPQPAAPAAAERPAQPEEQPAPAAPAATPVARRLAAELGVDLAAITGTGPGGRITKADVQAAAKAAPAPQAAPSGPAQVTAREGKVRATPAARRLAREAGIALSGLQGSGPRGRIQADDVRQAVAAQRLAAPAAAAEEVPTGPPLSTLIPLSGMRATIARRMTESYQQAPHIHLTLSVDVEQAEATRQRWSALAGEKVSLTVLLAKACAWALRRHPQLNATVEKEGIRQWHDVNIGVAVALPDGLIVPVLRQADARPVGELARKLKDLVERARQGQLLPQDVADGTFTLTNLGMFGIEAFDPILNPPQVAILGVGAVVPTAVPRGEEIVVRPLMRLTLAADHRAVDGALAAQFLQDLKQAIEDPSLMLL